MIWAFWEWLQSLFYTKELDICLVGLPNAGKTTLAGVLTNGEYIEGVSPTVGYNLRQLRKGYVQMKIWDLGYVSILLTMEWTAAIPDHVGTVLHWSFGHCVLSRRKCTSSEIARASC